MAANRAPRQNQGQQAQARTPRETYSPILTKETTGRKSPFKDPTIVHLEAQTDQISDAGSPMIQMSFRGGKELPGGVPNITHRQMREVGDDGKPLNGNRFKGEPVARRLDFNSNSRGVNVGQAVSQDRTAEMFAAAQASGAYHMEPVFEQATEPAVDAKSGETYQRRVWDDEGKPVLAQDQAGNPIPKMQSDGQGGTVQVQKIVAEVAAEPALQGQNLTIQNPRPIQEVFPAYDPSRHFDPTGQYQADAARQYRKDGDRVHANAANYEVKPSEHDIAEGRTQPFRFDQALAQNDRTVNEVKLAKQSLSRAAKREAQAQAQTQTPQAAQQGNVPSWGAPAPQAQTPQQQGPVWGSSTPQAPQAPLQSQSSAKPKEDAGQQYQQPALD